MSSIEDMRPPPPERTEESPPTFCDRCGAQCEMIPTGIYSTTTGKPVLRPACPTGLCDHRGHHHDWDGRFWGASRCRKCGQKAIYYD